MDDDDIQLLAFAEKVADPNDWQMPITYKGACLIGCRTRKMPNTKNLVKAFGWIDYHREGSEHVGNLLKNQQGSGAIVATWPGPSSNGEETQP